MQRARHLVGMAVRTAEGEKVGEVRDVLLDPAAHRVLGLALVTGPILRRPRYVRRTDIIDISDEGVTVKDSSCLACQPIGGHGLTSPASPVGKEVERLGVGDVGYVRDVLVDANRLSVWGFEISDGLVSDVMNGVSRLPRHEMKRLPGRLIWVPPGDEVDTHESPDGHMIEGRDGNHRR